MEMPHIDITQTNAAVSMKSNRPPLQIKQPHADLSIKQEHFDLIQISKTASKLYIDQTEAFADANLVSPLRSSKEFLDRTNQEVGEYVAKMSQQGDQLMKIENGTGAIYQIAAENSNLPRRETQLGWMPRSAFQVKFDYDPGELSFAVRKAKVEINVKRNEPIINIPKWQIDVYVKQKQSISFQAVGGNVNRKL
ncbi:DUF6470 family protein [Anaerobacillus sp. MEB173]|uniref:DUF6470 family protein n=1 Tax=Anaerobacillus sp. MEB173 TaxID=3383345 RepID=UPI003F93252D